MIYLDNAATTRLNDEVLEKMLPYYKGRFGNAGSIHMAGEVASGAVAYARSQVADLIRAKPDQIIFTSGGTEANNLVFGGLRKHLTSSGKRTIITSSVEHDSVIRASEALREFGFNVVRVGVDKNGVVPLINIEKAMTPDTGLVSVMYVNNEVGSVNQVREIAEMCRRKGILFHTDCVQAIGTKEVSMWEIGCDFASISSHKIHGPKGVGALFVRNKSILSPIICGGAEQEYGIRGGTENVPGIVGFGVACRRYTDKDPGGQIASVRKLFYKTLCLELKRRGVLDLMTENAGSAHGQGKIINVSFAGIDGETLVLLLSTKGVCVSTGSACRSHESEPSRVLLETGITPELARNSIRISFSEDNTEDEVVEAAKIIAGSVKDLYIIGQTG